ncbi:MAG: hypothetical protein MZW92_54590 [Comamonadaceae bacterium]|nr:hypothetical protein [Comamonadaceae bacterium]
MHFRFAAARRELGPSRRGRTCRGRRRSRRPSTHRGDTQIDPPAARPSTPWWSAPAHLARARCLQAAGLRRCRSRRCTATRSPRRCAWTTARAATCGPRAAPDGREATRWRSRGSVAARARGRQRRARRLRRPISTRARWPRCTRCSTTGSPAPAALAQAQRWKGARPMLPDGPPVIGASRRRRRLAQPRPRLQRLGAGLRFGSCARRPAGRPRRAIDISRLRARWPRSARGAGDATRAETTP